MRRLQLHERLIVLPALTALADDLRADGALATELDAKFSTTEKLRPLPKKTKKKQAPLEVEVDEQGEPVEYPYPVGHDSLYPPDARVWRTFRRTDDALRRYGLVKEADEILRLYGRSAVNTERTLEYVALLITDLELPEMESKKPEGDSKPKDENGPFRPGSFIWEGQKHNGLPEVAWNLLMELWCARHWICEIDTLGEDVWADHAIEPDVNMLGAARTILNNFFRDKEIPLRVTKKREFICLEKGSPRRKAVKKTA